MSATDKWAPDDFVTTTTPKEDRDDILALFELVFSDIEDAGGKKFAMTGAAKARFALWVFSAVDAEVDVVSGDGSSGDVSAPSADGFWDHRCEGMVFRMGRPRNGTPGRAPQRAGGWETPENYGKTLMKLQ